VSSKLQEPAFAWGLTALLVMDVLMVFMSLPFWRQLSYRSFYLAHIIGLVMILVAVSLRLIRNRDAC
jgi:ferric-chelate reductase